MKQRFCKVCGKLQTISEHGNSRTKNVPNEFRFIGNDTVELDTYDNFGTKNYTYLIDTDDYPLISRHKWCTALYKNKPYAMEGCSRIKLHRFILNPKPGSLIDHIDGNSLNNKKNNLRVASSSLNGINLLKDGLQHKGVYQKKSGKWYAVLQWQGKQYFSNMYYLQEEACFARYLMEQLFVPHTIIQCNQDAINKLSLIQKDNIINTINKKFHN